MRPIAELIEPDRVHRTVYTDQEIFDREIEQIFEKVWVYCGHESQVKAPGDYCTVQIGRQPMIMVRGRERRDPRTLQSLSAPRRRAMRRAVGQHGLSVRLLLPRLELSSRRGHPRHAAAPRLRGHPHDARPTRIAPMKRAARVESLSRFRVREPRERGPDASRNSWAMRASRSTTCATARPRARSRSCRSVTAWCSTRTGSSSWRISSTRCIRR